jgi:hypothetical protein
MTFDFTVYHKGSTCRAAFAVEAASRPLADMELERRMLAAGWTVAELVDWKVATVIQRGAPR